MGVQRVATRRNAQTEIVIECLLELLAQRLHAGRLIDEWVIESQVHFESAWASDIWDHRLSVTRAGSGVTAEIWCQTTCYKGNVAGKPEPNKTYEVRETLVEAVSVRQRADQVDAIVRTVHITVGDKDYAYGWFVPAKMSTFDQSLYIAMPDGDIFAAIETAAGLSTAEFRIREALASAVAPGGSLAAAVAPVVDALYAWVAEQGMDSQRLADSQYSAVAAYVQSHAGEIADGVQRSLNGGLNIKGRYQGEQTGVEADDSHLLHHALDELHAGNPFLRAADHVLADWPGFGADVNSAVSDVDPLPAVVRKLWTRPMEQRLVLRRLLMRAGANEAIEYVQDVDVAGVSEHNLYGGDHSSTQVDAIADSVAQSLESRGIGSAAELRVWLTGARARGVLKESRRLEGQNGSQVKPALHYVEQALQEHGFAVGDVPKSLRLGFHATLAEGIAAVRPYANLVGITRPSGELAGILKAKFFREPEFPRRCKEEAYVAFTMRHRVDEQQIAPVFLPPLIMFIDMAEDLVPPPRALRRLQGFGWTVAFRIDQLIDAIG